VRLIEIPIVRISVLSETRDTILELAFDNDDFFLKKFSAKCCFECGFNVEHHRVVHAEYLARI
jgi:hypothetical protein